MPTATQQIPEEWRVVKISDLCEVLSGSTPKTSEKEYWNGNIPWFTPLDLSKISTRYVRKSARQITDKGFSACSAKKIPPRSLIMSSRAPIGYFAINLEEATTNQGCKTFVCSEHLNVDFLYYYLNQFIDQVKRLGSGSTFAEVGKKHLEGLKITIPPIAEQKAIARILSKVDEEIEKVDQIIQRTEKLKKGLMQKLLSKGIGHKKFKKTELGEIPEEWEVVTLENFIELSYGSNLPKRKREEGEVPVYGSNGVTDRHNTALVKGPGIIIGRKGSIGQVHWSESDFWPIDTTYYVTEEKEKEKNKNIRWIYYKFQTLGLEAMNSASGIPGLNRNEVYNLKISVPPLPEQIKIVEILETVDKKLKINRKNKSKLNRLKKGLMADLLSGKVRTCIN
ncbi:restriction endonuclease subunit S [Candidatus Peregrinibacteria bacterium]|nr:restriction endonuclease subunit S [Candidatus Peregrinibacteria bacterium]